MGKRGLLVSVCQIDCTFIHKKCLYLGLKVHGHKPSLRFTCGLLTMARAAGTPMCIKATGSIGNWQGQAEMRTVFIFISNYQGFPKQRSPEKSPTGHFLGCFLSIA